MIKNRISETVGNINEKYINEAMTYTGEAKAVRCPVWMKRGVAAACLFIIVAALIAVPNLFGNNAIRDDSSISDSDSGNMTEAPNNIGENETGENSIISGFNSGSSSSYTTPKPGEYFCFVEVDEARKEYAGKDVKFLLGFDVFSADKAMGIEELSEEFQRLVDLGYKLYYVEDHWTYYGAGQKQYSPVVVGLFTEEELSDFKVSEKYGYAFRFETNGDGSSITINEEDVVSNFDSIIQ